MPIPEKQLETWSAQGSVQQSAATYQTIRNTLNDSEAPFHSRSFFIFLQGSYGNDTNVYRDSDVDIAMRLDQTYYSDLDNLTPIAKVNYERARDPATYGYHEFKAEVLAWLQKKYGTGVKAGKKAIFVPGSGNRRDADVLVCCRLRRYRTGSNGVDGEYDEGICFFLSDGTRIENFPKQHADNCTEKHQDTKQWFKPLVRVYKNMRNRMVDDGVLADGVAPSYYIEGMLWNVPDANFGTSYADSFCNTFNWLLKTDKTKLVCASGLHWLVRDNSNVSWPNANYDMYIAMAKKYWEEWGD